MKRFNIAVGTKLFIRGVTMYYTGRVVACSESEIRLSDAAWIADTGRFAQALETGTFNEVEPYAGEVVVNRESLIDYVEVSWELPRAQK